MRNSLFISSLVLTLAIVAATLQFSLRGGHFIETLPLLGLMYVCSFVILAIQWKKFGAEKSDVGSIAEAKLTERKINAIGLIALLAIFVAFCAGAECLGGFHPQRAQVQQSVRGS